MALDIHWTNIRSWVTLVLSMINLGLIKTAVTSLQPKKVFKTAIAMLSSNMQLMISFCKRNKT